MRGYLGNGELSNIRIREVTLVNHKPVNIDSMIWPRTVRVFM